MLYAIVACVGTRGTRLGAIDISVGEKGLLKEDEDVRSLCGPGEMPMTWVLLYNTGERRAQAGFGVRRRGMKTVSYDVICHIVGGSALPLLKTISVPHHREPNRYRLSRLSNLSNSRFPPRPPVSRPEVPHWRAPLFPQHHLSAFNGSKPFSCSIFVALRSRRETNDVRLCGPKVSLV